VSCGKSKKASILLWDVAQQECIQTKSVGELVSDFAFHPVKNLLFYVRYVLSIGPVIPFGF
jgi:uncharacterized membrane protein